MTHLPKDTQPSNPRATLSFECNHSLLTPFCMEGSGSANKRSEQNNNSNNHNNTLPFPFPPAFFWIERLLHNSALGVILKKRRRRRGMWNIPLLKL